jgi:hypothetical protein
LEGEGYEDTTEDAAGFEIASGVWCGDFEETIAEGGGNENASEILSVFEVC